jgi:hypothetical protein
MTTHFIKVKRGYTQIFHSEHVGEINSYAQGWTLTLRGVCWTADGEPALTGRPAVAFPTEAEARAKAKEVIEKLKGNGI